LHRELLIIIPQLDPPCNNYINYCFDRFYNSFKKLQKIIFPIILLLNDRKTEIKYGIFEGGIKFRRRKLKSLNKKKPSKAIECCQPEMHRQQTGIEHLRNLFGKGDEIGSNLPKKGT
jgi:hypothetical protein